MSMAEKDTDYLKKFHEQPNLSKDPFFNKKTGVEFCFVEKKCLNCPRAQGDCNSCVACVVADNIAAVLALMEPDVVERVLKYISVQHIVDCMKNPKGLIDKCRFRSTTFEKVYEFLMEGPGIVEEQYYRYVGFKNDCVDCKCPEFKDTAARKNLFRDCDRFRVLSYAKEPVGDYETMKRIIRGRPVGAEVLLTEEFVGHKGLHVLKRSSESGSSKIKSKPKGSKKRHQAPEVRPEEPPLSHAVLIIGYGTDPDGTHFYIIKNSWAGRKWGYQEAGGYAKIAVDLIVGHVYYPIDIAFGHSG